ncbi:hypothetical protein J437_LFUL012557 [Ladona fulva]|uniref:RNA-directed DNA polymerase n=1 Tax=Ladona fulva TaxID=123851 RepID=A0A8K0KW45_LADFU|nr:hypothetical protein J437_LFUL012557 [Ladona fulva]
MPSQNPSPGPYYLPWDRDLIREEQDRDEFCQKIKKELNGGGRRHANEFTQDQDGLLYRKSDQCHDQVVAPRSMINRILRAFHDAPWAGHMGVKRTLASVPSKFWWNTVRKDVENYCENCVSCQQRKNPRGPQRAPLQPLPEVTMPLQRVSMDIVGPISSTYKGNRYILTLQDVFTKYPEAIALPNQKPETVARAFVENIVLRHGAPRQLLTDRGTSFTSQLMKEVCKILGIGKLQTTAYHPAGDELVERSHRTLMCILLHSVDTKQRDWDDWLPFAISAYRSTPQTASGESPHFLMYGRDIEHDITGPLRVNFSTDFNYAAELRARLNIAFG